MTRINRKLWLFPVFAALLLLAGCGLPGNAKNRATYLLTEADIAKGNIESNRKALSNIIAENPRLQRFAEREEWDRKLDSISEELARLQSTTLAEIRQVLERDAKEETAQLTTLVENASGSLGTLKRQAPALVQRARDMSEVLTNLPEISEVSQTYASELETMVEEARKTLETQSAEHPSKASVMQDRFAKIAASFEELKEDNTEVQEQATRLENDEDLDLALALDNSRAIHAAREWLLAEIPDFNSWTAELDQSYTKILEDMRIEHFITIARSSWDEGSDFGGEALHTFPPKQVSESVYLELAPYTGVYGTYSKGWLSSGFNLRAPAEVEGINYAEDFPRNHNASEFWVEDAEINFYHKYRIISEAGERTTDWIAVDEEEFAPYVDALGMSIASKPYGYFEDEVITQPHPPGMAFVGDTRTGEWRQDSNGNSFWHYYGQFAMLNMLLGNTYGGNRYYRSEYNDWNRSRYDRPYYGSTSTGGRVFGTRGMASTSSRYQNTEYARGGYTKTPPRSVRQGSVRRGGGPGGRGK